MCYHLTKFPICEFFFSLFNFHLQEWNCCTFHTIFILNPAIQEISGTCFWFTTFFLLFCHHGSRELCSGEQHLDCFFRYYQIQSKHCWLPSCLCSSTSVLWVLIKGWHLLTAAEMNKGVGEAVWRWSSFSPSISTSKTRNVWFSNMSTAWGQGQDKRSCMKWSRCWLSFLFLQHIHIPEIGVTTAWFCMTVKHQPPVIIAGIFN